MSGEHTRIPVEAMTVPDVLARAAASRPDHEALVFPDTRLTYRELERAATRCARSLRALGAGPGDKIGILMPNSNRFVEVLLGASMLGAVVVPVNARFKPYELGHVIAHADLRVLVSAAGGPDGPDHPALVGTVLPSLGGQDPAALELSEAPLLRAVVDLGGERRGFVGPERFASIAERVADDEVLLLAERVRIRDIALLMYTSGTTARPKGCLLTHESLVRHAGNVARNRFFLTHADRYWDPLPLFHIGGIVPMLSCLFVGATFVHAGQFNADVALAQLQQERCTVAYPAFETLWLGVLNHPRFADADLGALRLIQNIATPERLIYLQSRLPHVVQVSSYGATECASNLTLPLPDDDYETRTHTLGHPLPGIEIKVVDPQTGERREPGVVGELCFRGYSLFEGYYKDPELTAAAIDADGWFHSADLAQLDAHGRLIYAGRLKDMLKVGGENVSALEVEDYLCHHVAVDIAQVVGAPDAHYGEVPAAFIQLKPDAQLTEAEIVDFCLGRIATFKVPRYVRFVDQWPMSGTKIQKFVLRELIAAELADGGITEAPRIAMHTHVTAEEAR
jgi:fatty-acyl-CoA synthase